jgi:DNA invertase Pin-like site-specific DNA recombinase
VGLEKVATGRGWTVGVIYEDAGISGAKGRDKRPELDRMLREAIARRFDVVMSWVTSERLRTLVPGQRRAIAACAWSRSGA